jgi:hypothetical protein
MSQRIDFVLLSKEIRVQNDAIGKLLVQIQPLLAVDELDPTRKAESDRLGEEVINRLRAEDLARQHTLGKI